MGIIGYTRGEKAIKKALGHYQDKESDLHNKVYASLQLLESTYEELKNRFIQRANKRISLEEKERIKALDKAGIGLENAQEHLEDVKKQGLKELIPMAETMVKVAERNIGMIENSSRANRVLIAKQNETDEKLWNWFDDFVALIVGSIEDNALQKVVIQSVVSGALIAGGLVGGPAIVGLAAVLSGIQLVYSAINNFKSNASHDAKTQTLEKGLMLLDVGNALGKKWLKALK